MNKNIVRSILRLSISVCFLSNSTFAQTVNFSLKKDGSFDLEGSEVKILNAYPALDNQPLRPLKVTVKDKSILYQLAEGQLTLDFQNTANGLSIKTSTTIKANGQIFIKPIFKGEVIKCNKIFKTAGAIIGNGGLTKWQEKESVVSTLITGLISEKDKSLIVSCREPRKYLTFSELYQEQGKNKINVVIQTEKVSVVNLPEIFITEVVDIQEGMKEEALSIAKIVNVKIDKKQAYHWCSWYYTFNNLTESLLKEYLDGFETIKPRIPFQTIQIDAGYHPHIGDWLDPSEKFPRGLEPAVKDILARGYKAGIWIGPYMVGNRSKLYKEHPDWVLQWGDGSPARFYEFYDEHRLWGALDEEYYTLDTSNPEVMAYLRNVFRTFKKMGITYFKTDFMVWGDQQSQNLKRKVPGKTSIEYQREFFQMIREEIGEESFWLGCIAPYTPFIGFADGMRISADITAKWKGTESMFEESKGNQHLNNVWWQNDPDAMILRNKFNRMTEAEVYSTSLWMGLLGGIVNTSEVMNQISTDRMELFRELEPSTYRSNAKFPYLLKNSPCDILVKEIEKDKTWIVLAVNRKDSEQSINLKINDLVNQNTLKVTAWKKHEKTYLGDLEHIESTIPSHDYKLYYISTTPDAASRLKLNGNPR